MLVLSRKTEETLVVGKGQLFILRGTTLVPVAVTIGVASIRGNRVELGTEVCDDTGNVLGKDDISIHRGELEPQGDDYERPHRHVSG